LSPCSPWRSMVEQISTCSLWKGPHARAGGCLKESVTLWGAHTGAGSCQDLWAHGERSPHRSRFADRACGPVGDPCWTSLFLKDCTLWKGRAAAHGKDSSSRSLWRSVSHERDLMLEQGQSVRSLPPKEEGAAETRCDEPTITPIPCSPALLGGRRQRNRSEVEPRMKGGVRGKCFKIWFYFSLSYSDLIGDKLNLPFLPKFSLFCP